MPTTRKRERRGVQQRTAHITSDANKVQVGGRHYKQFQIQPWDAILSWQLGFLDGNAVKYLARWRHKGGVEDLKKAKHYLDKLIEVGGK